MSSRDRSPFPLQSDLGEGIVNRSEFAEMIGVPEGDVAIGTCMLKPYARVRGGYPVFKTEDALKAMIQFYRRQYEGNKELYQDRHMEMYRDNALKYRARMERCETLMAGIAIE